MGSTLVSWIAEYSSAISPVNVSAQLRQLISLHIPMVNTPPSVVSVPLFRVMNIVNCEGMSGLLMKICGCSINAMAGVH